MSKDLEGLVGWVCQSITGVRLAMPYQAGGKGHDEGERSEAPLCTLTPVLLHDSCHFAARIS